ncbi:ketosteroid isomerase-like protein [Dyadobacter sp. BE34]|uniref:Ketosteroid isomerase-like protein n=1 Tax=Dyadobacter fermentans TaxID=94254 RepID=A0ABU1R777_9BACT|nr:MULTISPECIES: nuclear transport factor 2 family protein [Dyadobacter]MDR6809264.1 ketosteroid isomerase-like protein [Dyadobacter fermentans]MDR7047142.1 ketosteroid isomerase-like protein [Dyadobacter sp. BE242]MDR7194891.1 ketosteroid isomerase-like protein [Dyadobacter sp. BE34]MDR7214564.1 ketosteroid isomerase-like protein [Dyadobacter sp. BE31]MDR7266813.1 ketosteroid isomerase-like protein [Dyadobacter sp. BE32]
MMKQLLTIFLLTFASLAALAQDNAPQPIDGTDCSNLFFQAMLDENAAAVGNLISNDFTVTNYNGQTIDGRALQQAIGQGYIIVDSGMLTGTRTRTYGDVAVVQGFWNVSARIQNNGFSGNVAYTSVCVRSGGKWKVTTVQLTPAQ